MIKNISIIIKQVNEFHSIMKFVVLRFPAYNTLSVSDDDDDDDDDDNDDDDEPYGIFEIVLALCLQRA